MKRWLTLCLAVASMTGGALAEDLASPEQVIARMKNAATFYHTHLSTHGGYASSWTLDPIVGQTEHSESTTVISIQPPGTTTVGLSLVRAYQATGETFFLKAARDAAGALIACQLASGGWSSDFDFAPEKAGRYFLRTEAIKGGAEAGKRRNRSTLDDNKTQSALLFLLELAHLPEMKGDEALSSALQYGLDSLLAAQESDGSWPQQFEGAADPDAPVLPAKLPEGYPKSWPKESYIGYATLNDGNLHRVMMLLLRANELTGEGRYLASARRLGDFLLRVQLPVPQRAWAQQYNEEREPAWARKFEPPSVSSIESFGAVETLFELWLATGADRYRSTLGEAIDWLEASQRPDGKWARFYELHTNRPLFCEAQTYQLTYDDSNLPTHYGFLIDSGFGRRIERMREALATPREELLEDRALPDSAEGWERRARSLRGKVRAALEAQHPDGYWRNGDLVDARLLSRHLEAMATYVEASRRAKEGR